MLIETVPAAFQSGRIHQKVTMNGSESSAELALDAIPRLVVRSSIHYNVIRNSSGFHFTISLLPIGRSLFFNVSVPQSVSSS